MSAALHSTPLVKVVDRVCLSKLTWEKEREVNEIAMIIEMSFFMGIGC